MARPKEPRIAKAKVAEVALGIIDREGLDRLTHRARHRELATLVENQQPVDY